MQTNNPNQPHLDKEISPNLREKRFGSEEELVKNIDENNLEDAEEKSLVNPSSSLTQRNKAYNICLGLLFSSGGIYFGFFMSIFNPLGYKLLKFDLHIEDKMEIEQINGNLSLLMALGAITLSKIQ